MSRLLDENGWVCTFLLCSESDFAMVVRERFAIAPSCGRLCKTKSCVTCRVIMSPQNPRCPHTFYH